MFAQEKGKIAPGGVFQDPGKAVEVCPGQDGMPAVKDLNPEAADLKRFPETQKPHAVRGKTFSEQVRKGVCVQ